MYGKKIDIVVLTLLLAFSTSLAYFTRPTFLGNVAVFSIIFSVPPTAYLALRAPKNWKKICISMFVFGVLFLFPFDLIAEYTHTWDTLSYVASYRILGVELAVDNLIWGMFMTMYTITFYQHFMPNEKTSQMSPRLRYAVVFSIIATIIILAILFKYPSLLSWRYPYLFLGIAAIVPPIALGFYKPFYIPKMTTITIYFFFFYFIQEIFGLRYNYWIYPGNNYIGWVNVVGVTFPFEELFFWMMLYAPTIVSYYEIFVNKSVIRK